MILERAARLASVEGLDGLSIGRLAEDLSISKSGLYAHFRSKEELQLAAIRTARGMYEADLVAPAFAEPAGRARLLRFVDLYLDYVRDGPFPGGCFFIAAAVDRARSRTRVKALLGEVQRDLLGFLEQCVADAQSAGDVSRDVDASHLAFAVDALMTGADRNFLLFDDPGYLELARVEVRRLLGAPPGS